MTAPVTDEEIGAAIRKLSQHCAPGWTEDRFQFYARHLVQDAEHVVGQPLGACHVERARVLVYPTERIDGALERLVEMVIGVPCGVAGFPERGIVSENLRGVDQ